MVVDSLTDEKEILGDATATASVRDKSGVERVIIYIY
jgi:hypothetical protein